MKKLVMMLVVAMLVLACGTVAQAAVQNTETFETYGTTDDFENVADTGWSNFSTGEGESFEIRGILLTQPPSTSCGRISCW